MGTGDTLLGGEPVMDWHSLQGGVAILIGMFHSKETGISYGRLALVSLYLPFLFDTLVNRYLYWMPKHVGILGLVKY